MERMMKLQDVLLKAMAKKITWWEAAEIIGITDRLEKGGSSGLVDRRKGKPSDRRVSLATVEQVLRLYQETCFDLNTAKRGEEHGIQAARRTAAG